MTVTTLNPHEWLDVQAVATEYGMHINTVYRLFKEPDAPVLAIGGRRKVRRGELEAWLRSRTIRGAGAPN